MSMFNTSFFSNHTLYRSHTHDNHGDGYFYLHFPNQRYIPFHIHIQIHSVQYGHFDNYLYPLSSIQIPNPSN